MLPTKQSTSINNMQFVSTDHLPPKKRFLRNFGRCSLPDAAAKQRLCPLYMTPKDISTVSNSGHPSKYSKATGGIVFCLVCTKGFASKSSLAVHLRRHTGERPFLCTVCPMSFTDLSTARKHLLIHTGSRPHQCPVCSQRFTQSGNMRRHLRAIHQGIRPRNAQCPINLSGHYRQL